MNNRKAEILCHDIPAGILEELPTSGGYRFSYYAEYAGPPVSLTMPVSRKVYDFDDFPPYFDGLLPEGPQLEALLRIQKIDRRDYFRQLVAVGADLVGAATARELTAARNPK